MPDFARFSLVRRGADRGSGTQGRLGARDDDAQGQAQAVNARGAGATGRGEAGERKWLASAAISPGRHRAEFLTTLDHHLDT